MKKLLTLTAAVALLALGAPPAGAIEAGEKIWIHGYGNWRYGRTDGNEYLGGNDEGSFDKLELSLAASAQPAQKIGIHTQIFIEKDEEGTETSIDFAFAEYTFDKALAFRIGAVKQPFGLLTEIFDVGTLHPFDALPQGIYGPAGIVSEKLLGAGFTGDLEVGGGWRLQYDFYGGDMEAALKTPWAEAKEGEPGFEGITDNTNLIGGRINVHSPELGLLVGASAYTATEDTKAYGEASARERHTAWGAHAEYEVGPVTLRSEYAGVNAADYSSNGAYGELAWRINHAFQVAARYDWSKTNVESADVDGELLKHQDIALAVDYFFSPNFVLKLCWHQVTGNRFTGGDASEEAQDRKTNLVTVGTSFSF